MITNSTSSSRFHFKAALAILLVGLGAIASCKKAPTEPSANALSSPFIGDPGIQVTQTNDAGMIAWLPNETDIAYTALHRDGPAIMGILKAVNINSKAVLVLDGNVQIFNSIEAEGDSVFYEGGGSSTPAGIYVVSASGTGAAPLLISSGGYAAVSPNRVFVASVKISYDSLQILNLQDHSVRAYPMQANEMPSKFSPDSRQLLLSSERILSISDGTYSMVPHPIPDIRSSTWNADGIWALTISQTPTSSPMTLDVYTVTNLMTGQSKEIWRSSATDMCGFEFAMSGDGTKVAFLRCTPMYIVPTIHYLYVCDIAKGTATKLLSVVVRLDVGAIPGIDSFAFSADGKRIAYAVEGNIYYSNL